MAAVFSTMQALGSQAPQFSLNNVSNDAIVGLEDFIDKPLLVMFIFNHCPYVVHLVDVLSQLANRAQGDGFGVVAISSNDAGVFPQDGPEAMQRFAIRHEFQFPYLFDESQETAKAYGAACTPDFFVFDKRHELKYRGQMDASRPNNSIPISGDDLSAAIAAIVNNESVNQNQVASIGCSIKWRSGNEPSYF